MRILLLGGTAMLGRAIARAALTRGMDVTCAARGTAPPEDGIRFVRIDRDEDDGLRTLADEAWDATIDLASQPVHARRAARDLRAAHRIHVSTTSVYLLAHHGLRDEDAPVHEPLDGDRMAGPEDYPAAKVACEEATRAAGDDCTIVRAGLIGGDGDASARSGYYPWRCAHPTGADVLAPDPAVPVSLIDAEDLAAWIVRCVEHRITGTLNAAGPPTTLREVLEVARALSPAAPPLRHVPDDALAAAGVGSWMGPRSLPLWIDDPAWRYATIVDASRARALGLRTRSLERTLAAALAFEERRVGERPAGLTDDEERALRATLA